MSIVRQSGWETSPKRSQRATCSLRLGRSAPFSRKHSLAGIHDSRIVPGAFEFGYAQKRDNGVKRWTEINPDQELRCNKID